MTPAPPASSDPGPAEDDAPSRDPGRAAEGGAPSRHPERAAEGDAPSRHPERAAEGGESKDPPPQDQELRGRHRAKRSLGQNFLVDVKLQRRIVDAIEPHPQDEVLEIGPGKGALTRHLAGRVRRLVLAELDRDLAARLREDYGDRPDVRVIEGDVLELTLEEVSDDPAGLKVIGNIPYNITTPIVFSLLERRPRPRRIVLMVQREVAERMAAEPGGKVYGALAVGVQSVATVERVLNVARGAFRPVPDVESAVVRIEPHRPPPLDAGEEAALRELTRRAFGQRRKQFQKILRGAYGLDAPGIERLEEQTGLDLTLRPETFSPEEFIRLSRALKR